MTKNILLTGATGVLGSEILYALLKQKLIDKQSLLITVIIRKRGESTAKERLTDLLHPRNLPHYLNTISRTDLLTAIDVFEGDCQNLTENFDTISEKGKISLIHCASSVNLGKSEKAKQEVILNNYDTTINLIHRLGFNLDKVIYVSTAFSSGVRTGRIDDDYVSLDANDLKFRNHYEYYKHQAEQEVVALSKRFGFSYSIARPSVICGRMLFEPKYFAFRYIVFYMLGAFFKRIKTQRSNLRIYVPEHATLNVIPVDYVALAITRLLEQEVKQLNIVASKATDILKSIQIMLNESGYKGAIFVDKPFSDKNSLERIYAKTVGEQVDDYVLTERDSYFDAKKIRQIMADYIEPNIEENFYALYKYVYDIDFNNKNVLATTL